MKYESISVGMFIVRTRALPWLRVLSGEICYVEAVSGSELHLRITKDCVPSGDVYAVPQQADDDGWYDVSDLVLDANACIRPSGNDVEFPAPVASNYRNFLGLGNSVKPLSNQEAVGKVCLLGEGTGSNIAFAKSGVYVVSADDNGFVIGYQGYCDSSVRDNVSLRILNLMGTNRKFYPAGDIVNACAVAYREDCMLADKYTRNLLDASVVSSSDSSISAGRSRVGNMKLEAAVC